ncbi:MAG: hypothetical protein C0475_08030 [Planctomyces sp.]|nr:hypothetical protein [Planctomyces sp.]
MTIHAQQTLSITKAQNTELHRVADELISITSVDGTAFSWQTRRRLWWTAGILIGLLLSGTLLAIVTMFGAGGAAMATVIIGAMLLGAAPVLGSAHLRLGEHNSAMRDASEELGAQRAMRL